MKLYSVISGDLAEIEAEPVGTCLARVTVAGVLPVGRHIVTGDRWSTTPEGAWTAEAHRLDLEADRAAHRARAASIEAEALTERSQQAFAKAQALRGEG